VRGDRTGRIKVPISLALGPEPGEVRDILVAAAKAHELVLALPAPNVLFNVFSETGLKFDLVAYVGDVETSSRVKSDLYFDIFSRFKDAGLAVAPAAAPPAVANVTINGLEKLRGLVAVESPSASPAALPGVNAAE